MKLKCWACALVGLLIAASLLRANEADLFEKREFTGADGKVLKYRLLKPAAQATNEKLPLVLFMHGAGERGNDNGAQLKNGVLAFA